MKWSMLIWFPPVFVYEVSLSHWSVSWWAHLCFLSNGSRGSGWWFMGRSSSSWPSSSSTAPAAQLIFTAPSKSTSFATPSNTPTSRNGPGRRDTFLFTATRCSQNLQIIFITHPVKKLIKKKKIYIYISAVKRLIASKINKSFCLHNISVCTVYIYYVYINTHTCMYI